MGGHTRRPPRSAEAVPGPGVLQEWGTRVLQEGGLRFCRWTQGGAGGRGCCRKESWVLQEDKEAAGEGQGYHYRGPRVPQEHPCQAVAPH